MLIWCFPSLSQTEYLALLLISAVDDVWVLYSPHLQASIQRSRRFLSESLSVSATVSITCHGSFDSITYGLTEDPLINWTVSNVERIFLNWSPLNDPTSRAYLTDFTISFSLSGLKKNSSLLISLQKIGSKTLEHITKISLNQRLIEAIHSAHTLAPR